MRDRGHVAPLEGGDLPISGRMHTKRGGREIIEFGEDRKRKDKW
jgi:hypothetical protein